MKLIAVTSAENGVIYHINPQYITFIRQSSQSDDCIIYFINDYQLTVTENVADVTRWITRATSA